MKNNALEILQKLVSIPSWVDSKTNEREIGEWIFKYLKQNSDLTIIKQRVDKNRFNIIAKKGVDSKVLVTGHMDTVQPNLEWKQNPIKPNVVGGKIFGLGASDMKAGVAIMINLACNKKIKNGTMFLFYCDEEYDFAGMKRFIKRFKGKVSPELVISLDGEGLQIANSCRGLTELTVDVVGIAGHAANPGSGINAITESFKIIARLKRWLSNYKRVELGNSTLNIAKISGGSDQGNIIAERCKYIVEIRVANERLNAGLVKDFITNESKKLDLKVENIQIRHDLGSWITKTEDLSEVLNIPKNKNTKSAKKSGYIDIQMLWKTFNKVPTFSFGAGTNGMSHKSDEYVKISDVLKAQKFLETILTNK